MYDLSGFNKEDTASGYVVDLFQYARRYHYNYKGMITYFNDVIDEYKNDTNIEPPYISFGDFDCIQIIPVNDFAKFHDVSNKAKKWLGKRQVVLLYDLHDNNLPAKLHFDSEKWINNNSEDKDYNFFCLSMVSLTNEIMNYETSDGDLLKTIRRKIINIVSEISNKLKIEICCDVFGTFNSSELAIVWLAEQYTHVLKIIDYIKHIQIKPYDVDGNLSNYDISAFLACFSTIGTSFNNCNILSNLNKIEGTALVQISIHDVIKSYDKLQELVKTIFSQCGNDVNNLKESVHYSVGEYDLVLQLEAKQAISLLKYDKALSIVERDSNNHYLEKKYGILRTNIRLLYEKTNDEIEHMLDEMHNNGEFVIQYKSNVEKNKNIEININKYIGNRYEQNNYHLYCTLREKLHGFTPSTGMIDILDLIYTDYISAISSSYSAIWVSDLNRQFKAFLNVITESFDLNVYSEKNLQLFWNDFKDLTNAFKQQIYHLMQSNRMFFETPSCHFRSTGQFDYLMHSLFGIAKKILNCIYLIKDNESQSELVPLITVNTVPQVKTQLYYEYKEDSIRVINLDIPQSIVFNPYRGTCYISHELFHHVAPLDRKTRNKNMGKLLVSQTIKKQFMKVFNHLLWTPIDNMQQNYNLLYQAESYFKQRENLHLFNKMLFGYNYNYKSNKNIAPFNDQIVEYIDDIYEEIEKKCFSNINDDFYNGYYSYNLCTAYQLKLMTFIENPNYLDFKNIFKDFFINFISEVHFRFTQYLIENGYSQSKQVNEYTLLIQSQLRYFILNHEYLNKFLETHNEYKVSSSYISKPSGQESIKYTWEAVREACCDIAMITLNNMSKVDYILFCIQAWIDVKRDKDGNKYQIASKDSLRCSLVLEYFNRRDNKFLGWDVSKYNSNNKEFILTSAETDEFIRRYFTLYLSSSNNNCYKIKAEAYHWINKYTDMLRFFHMEYIVYYPFIRPILEDFDIDYRISNISNDSKKNIIKKIVSGLREKMTKYSNFLKRSSISINDIDYLVNLSHTTDIHSDIFKKIKKHKMESFEYDLELIRYFQKQESLESLSEILSSSDVGDDNKV